MRNFRNFLRDFTKKDLRIYQNRMIWFIVPFVLLFVAFLFGTIYQVAPSVNSFANVGIDFQGGTVLKVEAFGVDDFTGANYRQNLDIIKGVVEGENHRFRVAMEQTSGTSAIIVRYTNSRDGIDYNARERTEEMFLINNQIQADIRAEFESRGISNIETTVAVTGAAATSRLLNTMLLSLLITSVLILIYIIIRFDLFSGISVLVGLLHDAIMLLAFTVIFRVQMNSSIVAALITIVGYSFNNTIVLLDRVRENVSIAKTKREKIDVTLMVNTSVKETLTRSVYTTITTLFAIGMVAIIGVPAIREFALPIVFGLIAGFFSSVFVSPCLWGVMVEYRDRRKERKEAGVHTKAVPATSKK
jgi:preprotein translocase subunit SecF